MNLDRREPQEEPAFDPFMMGSTQQRDDLQLQEANRRIGVDNTIKQTMWSAEEQQNKQKEAPVQLTPAATVVKAQPESNLSSLSDLEEISDMPQQQQVAPVVIAPTTQVSAVESGASTATESTVVEQPI
mgnify:CR=1 FL=1